ncbi:S24 family peptidase [Verrucomicrobium sp. BvORR106]|uniref:S24 family peptidase n=1 Tax=Verrucomicrobium sp. BvORR106 TaxID=1403819 RepID=UPI00056FABCC|nr:S24 family peptidase [Verrucomicrobium sp. BvORR106]
MPHLRSDKMNAANAAGRFQALRARLGISRPQLAQWLGVTRQYITKIEGGMPPSKPVMLLVERLEQEARQNSDINGKPRDVEPVSRGFALAGAALENLSRAQPGVRPNHGTVHPASAPQSQSAAPTPTSRANGVQLEAPVFAARSVPLLAMHEAADLPSPDHAAHHGSQHLAFVVEDEQAFAVRITGEAMAPHYPEGSIAIVCPGLASRNGDLVLARLKDERGGGTMLRLVHFIQDGESLVLTSTHAAYPPLTVQKDDLLWLAPVTVSLRHLR